MKISFPQKTVLHRRDPLREPEPVFMINGHVLLWEDAQEIYFQVQANYDRMDLRQEMASRMEQAMLTPEEIRDIDRNADEIVRRYRSVLDNDVGNTWNDTLGNVLYDFLHRKTSPELW